MKNVPVSSVLSIVFGVIILLVPQILSYALGIYLILVGALAITKEK